MGDPIRTGLDGLVKWFEKRKRGFKRNASRNITVLCLVLGVGVLWVDSLSYIELWTLKYQLKWFIKEFSEQQVSMLVGKTTFVWLGS